MCGISYGDHKRVYIYTPFASDVAAMEWISKNDGNHGNMANFTSSAALVYSLMANPSNVHLPYIYTSKIQGRGTTVCLEGETFSPKM